MAGIDPKQLLFRHVEKIVLLAALAMLVWSLWVYPPWTGKSPQANDIERDIKIIKDRQQVEYGATSEKGKVVPMEIGKVDNYVARIQNLMQVPWKSPDEVMKYPPTWYVFEDEVGQPPSPEAPPAPPVSAPTEVLAKAEKNRVIVIFRLDERAQRMQLQDSRQRDYEKGLPFYKVVITRQDMSTPNSTPEELNKDGQWLPAGLPKMYGGPSDQGSSLDEPGPWRAGSDVVVLSQRQIAQASSDDRRKFEEELRRQQLKAKEAAAGGATPAPGPGPRPGPPSRTTPAKGPADKTAVGTEEPWFWFVDNDVETEGKYKYTVSIVVRNPVYGMPRYRNSKEVPEFLSSTGTASNPVEIASFKKWFFTGGMPNIEQGVCIVQVLTTEEQKMDAAKVLELVKQIKDGKVGAATEPPGEWVKDRFSVKPGEEIGGPKTAKLGGGQTVPVDFSTGIQTVIVADGFQVVEEERTRLVATPEGMQRLKIISRTVVPKLGIWVLDRKGDLYRKWQEQPPN